MLETYANVETAIKTHVLLALVLYKVVDQVCRRLCLSA